MARQTYSRLHLVAMLHLAEAFCLGHGLARRAASLRVSTTATFVDGQGDGSSRSRGVGSWQRRR